MAKKRVHEIAKEHGLSSKELLERLHAAGVEAKAAASSVDEALALQAIGGNGSAPPPGDGAQQSPPSPPAPDGGPDPPARPTAPPPPDHPLSVPQLRTPT